MVNLLTTYKSLCGHLISHKLFQGILTAFIRLYSGDEICIIWNAINMLWIPRQHEAAIWIKEYLLHYMIKKGTSFKIQIHIA